MNETILWSEKKTEIEELKHANHNEECVFGASDTFSTESGLHFLWHILYLIITVRTTSYQYRLSYNCHVFS